MPVYEEKITNDGRKKYFIRTYVKNELGKTIRITRRNKDWVGRDGYWLASQEEIRLKRENNVSKNDIKLNDIIAKKMEQNKTYLKQSSLIRYNEFFNIYIIPYFENKKIFDITSKNIIDWHEWLSKKSISINTMKKIHNLLNTVFDFAVSYYGLTENVCKNVGNFKSKRGYSKNKIQFLTYEEFLKFIENESNPIYRDFFSILFFTGMRRGELLALTIDDIDFDNKIISINKSINPKNGDEATVPKTDKANRKIPMVEETYKILKKYKKKKIIFGLEKIKPSTLSRKCHDNCMKANINKHIRVHDFRHSFVAMCIESGIQIEKISEYVGHENISTTYNIYSHLYPNAKLELVNKLNLFLKNSAKNSAIS